MALSKELQKEIVDIISKILTQDYKIILFGSYVKGTENKYSDIDIALDTDSPIATEKWSLIEEAFEESNISQKIDVVDYHRVKESFKKIIDDEGIIINLPKI